MHNVRFIKLWIKNVIDNYFMKNKQQILIYFLLLENYLIVIILLIYYIIMCNSKKIKIDWKYDYKIKS